eukprot:gene23175-30386_t
MRTIFSKLFRSGSVKLPQAHLGGPSEKYEEGKKPNVKRLSGTKTDATTAAAVNDIARKSALVRNSTNPAKKDAAPTDMLSAINDEWHDRKSEGPPAAPVEEAPKA